MQLPRGEQPSEKNYAKISTILTFFLSLSLPVYTFNDNRGFVVSSFSLSLFFFPFLFLFFFFFCPPVCVNVEFYTKGQEGLLDYCSHPRCNSTSKVDEILRTNLSFLPFLTNETREEGSFNIRSYQNKFTRGGGGGETGGFALV